MSPCRVSPKRSLPLYQSFTAFMKSILTEGERMISWMFWQETDFQILPKLF